MPSKFSNFAVSTRTVASASLQPKQDASRTPFIADNSAGMHVNHGYYRHRLIKEFSATSPIRFPAFQPRGDGTPSVTI